MKYNHFKDLISAEMNRIETLAARNQERIIWPYATNMYANSNQQRTLLGRQTIKSRFTFSKLFHILAIF